MRPRITEQEACIAPAYRVRVLEAIKQHLCLSIEERDLNQRSLMKERSEQGVFIYIERRVWVSGMIRCDKGEGSVIPRGVKDIGCAVL